MAEIHEENGVSVVFLDKRYDAFQPQSLDQLGEQLLAIASESAQPKVVLDFGRTDYFGSNFIEVVFRAWKRVRQKDGEFVVCGLNDFCAEILRVTRLDQVWPSYPNRDEAIRALAGVT